MIPSLVHLSVLCRIWISFLHARLWSKVLRLDLVVFLHSSLHSLQVSRRLHHREVVAVHRQRQLPVHVLEVARSGQPSLKSALLQKRRVLLNPVLRGISGSVQAQVKSRNLALVTRLEVLDGKFSLDSSCGLGIEVRPSDVNRHYSVRIFSGLIACTHQANKSFARTPMEGWHQISPIENPP